MFHIVERFGSPKLPREKSHRGLVDALKKHYEPTHAESKRKQAGAAEAVHGHGSTINYGCGILSVHFLMSMQHGLISEQVAAILLWIGELSGGKYLLHYLLVRLKLLLQEFAAIMPII